MGPMVGGWGDEHGGGVGNAPHLPPPPNPPQTGDMRF